MVRDGLYTVSLPSSDIPDAMSWTLERSIVDRQQWLRLIKPLIYASLDLEVEEPSNSTQPLTSPPRKTCARCNCGPLATPCYNVRIELATPWLSQLTGRTTTCMEAAQQVVQFVHAAHIVPDSQRVSGCSGQVPTKRLLPV